jgi:hypothetical protein
MRQGRRELGPSADLSKVRHDALLRRLTEPPRDQACSRQQASRNRVGRAGGALVVLLSGRRFCRVVKIHLREPATGRSESNLISPFFSSGSSIIGTSALWRALLIQN